MSLLHKKSVLAAKIETTPGTAISLSASDAVFNVQDLQFQPTVEFDELMGQSSFDRLPGSIGPRAGKFTFSHPLIPGSSAHPAWALAFFPACGLVASTNTYTPRTEDIGSNVKTLTMAAYVNGLYRELIGCMGNVTFRFTSGRRIMMDFEFTGILSSDPSDVAIITPTYPTIQGLRFVSSAISVASAFTPIVEAVEINLGNNVILREDSSTSSGYKTALVTDRRITGTMNPETTLVATKDLWTEWLALTEQSLAIGPLASGGIGFTFTMPKIQITNIQTGDRNGVHIDQVEFQANRDAAAGDDALSIALDITP